MNTKKYISLVIAVGCVVTLAVLSHAATNAPAGYEQRTSDHETLVNWDTEHPVARHSETDPKVLYRERRELSESLLKENPWTGRAVLATADSLLKAITRDGSASFDHLLIKDDDLIRRVSRLQNAVIADNLKRDDIEILLFSISDDQAIVRQLHIKSKEHLGTIYLRRVERKWLVEEVT